MIDLPMIFIKQNIFCILN